MAARTLCGVRSSDTDPICGFTAAASSSATPATPDARAEMRDRVHIRASCQFSDRRVDLGRVHRREVAADKPRASVVHPVAGPWTLGVSAASAQRNEHDHVTIRDELLRVGAGDETVLHHDDRGPPLRACHGRKDVEAAGERLISRHQVSYEPFQFSGGSFPSRRVADHLIQLAAFDLTSACHPQLMIGQQGDGFLMRIARSMREPPNHPVVNRLAHDERRAMTAGARQPT